MAGINHLDENSSNGSREKGSYPNDGKYNPDHTVNISGAGDIEDDESNNLHRGLKSRQITMIAIGGAIGTGLIIGT
jgi:amino acid transporter